MLRSAAIFLTLMACGATALPAQMDDATRQLSRDIFRQLIEINTTGTAGSTTVAAEAMARRLRDAGFSDGRRAHAWTRRARVRQFILRWR